MKSSPPQWRNFEIQVAEIESALSGCSASIKSPDFIADIDTGEMREVDALLRLSVDSTTVLIAFECRRRNAPQDVTWIEQLMGKKLSLGLEKIIAVSAKGFTSAAKIKAAKRGIELRQISQMKTAALDEIRKRLSFAAFRFPGLLSGMSLRYGVGQQPRGIATPHFNKNLEDFGLKMTFGYRYSDGQPVNLQDFVQQACLRILPQLLSLREGISHVNVDLVFPEPQYYYLVDVYKYAIKEVNLKLDLNNGILPFNIAGASTYIMQDVSIGKVFQTQEVRLDETNAARLTVVFTEDEMRVHPVFSAIS